MDDLKKAQKRIAELEEEVARLTAELEEYRSKKPAGRKKHNESWTKSYMDFEMKFKSGKTIVEIVEEGDISRRTAYRYKAYYDAMLKEHEKMQDEGKE